MIEFSHHTARCENFLMEVLLVKFSVDDIKRLIQEAIDLATETYTFSCAFSIVSLEIILKELNDTMEEQKIDVLCRLGKTLVLSINKTREKSLQMCA